MKKSEITPHDIPDHFWSVLAIAKQALDGYKDMLNTMTKEELYKFYWTYRYAMGVLKVAPYVNYLNPGLSGDGTEDVCMWIVAQGKDYYLSIIDEPKKMPFDVDDPDPDCIFLNLVVRIYGEKYDEIFEFPEDQGFLFT